MALKILIRLPNWLGDVVMATPLLQVLHTVYPDAVVDVIVKKGLDQLIPHLPGIRKHYVFSKADYKGVRGAWRFGREIAATEQYDLMICLPTSFSSAVMARATGAAIRIGYRKELRGFLLTHAYDYPITLHYAEMYVQLLRNYAKTTVAVPPALLKVSATRFEQYIIVNINSEASARRLPKEKAIEFICGLRAAITLPIVLVGGPGEASFVNEVYAALPDQTGIENKAGKTNLPELLSLFAGATVVLTTDSGPAHAAAAVGAHAIVITGAGNEKRTAPFNANHTILRLGQLPCEPCISNTCKKFGVPRCLTLLEQQAVTQSVMKVLASGDKTAEQII